MKKSICLLLSVVVLIVSILVFLNLQVTTRQGINYQWHSIKIPLYLKILDFFDRHYNYKALVKRIVKDSNDDSERVLDIFKWTYQNIKKAPKGLPIVDDHVWHIIVRGYGAKDQFSDVFSTLCNYAGVDAYFSWVSISAQEKKGEIPLSFVKIKGRWSIFDPYYGVYFRNKNGEFAGIKEIKDGDWQAESLDINSDKLNINYAEYFENISDIKNPGLTRANIQSPLKRLLFEIKKKYDKS